MLEQFVQAMMAQLDVPRADAQKNIRALAAEMISKMDLVTREEMLRQEQQLSTARQMIETLSQRLDALVSSNTHA